MGQYDAVCISEAPDDETATSMMLTLGYKGNVSTQTCRAFTAAEMDRILAKMGK